MSRGNASSLPFARNCFVPPPCYAVGCGKAEFNLLIESTVIPSDFKCAFQVNRCLTKMFSFSLLSHTPFEGNVCVCKGWSTLMGLKSHLKVMQR